MKNYIIGAISAGLIALAGSAGLTLYGDHVQLVAVSEQSVQQAQLLELIRVAVLEKHPELAEETTNAEDPGSN